MSRRSNIHRHTRRTSAQRTMAAKEIKQACKKSSWTSQQCVRPAIYPTSNQMDACSLWISSEIHMVESNQSRQLRWMATPQRENINSIIQTQTKLKKDTWVKLEKMCVQPKEQKQQWRSQFAMQQHDYEARRNKTSSSAHTTEARVHIPIPFWTSRVRNPAEPGRCSEIPDKFRRVLIF